MPELLGAILGMLLDVLIVYFVIKKIFFLFFKKSNNNIIYAAILSFIILYLLRSSMGHSNIIYTYILLAITIIIDIKRGKHHVSPEETREQKMADSY